MTGHLKLLLSGVVLLFCSVLIAGCGNSSSSSDAESDSSPPPVAADADTCGKLGSLYNGCYSSSIISSAAKWNGACTLDSVSAGEYVYLYFKESNKCSFSWVRASGDVGENWRKLGTDALINMANDEWVIRHTAENVHQVRLCANGVDDANDVRTCL